MIDFATLEPPSSPNSFLMCPPGVCRRDAPDAESELVSTSPQALLREWLAIAEAAPRTTVKSVSPDGLGAVLEQKSRMFGFVDEIHVRAFDMDKGRAALAVYSFSHTGHYDFGVNEKRVRRWTDAALVRAETVSKSDDRPA